MKKIRHVTVMILTVLICFVFVPGVFAHPLGNFTINQYIGLKIGPEKVLLDYAVDMAEIPAFQEIAAFDVNGNGQADPSEAAAYRAGKCTALQPDLKLLLNNRPVSLTLGASSVEFPAGVGGLPTLRLTCEFRAPLDLTENNSSLSFANNAFPERLGWKEIVVLAEGVSVQGNFATNSASNRLTSYPQDLLTSPLDQRQVEFEVTSLGLPAQSGSSVTTTGTSSLADRNDAFTRLILLEEINLSTLLIALAISFIWGAMHALTPGHGKTIVGAYLVGSRGTIKHALYLGLTTTITHTLGVFALGLITLFAAQYVVPETLYPWMSFLSGLFVVGIGINLVLGRIKSSGLRELGNRFSLRKFARVQDFTQNTAVTGRLPAKLIVEEIDPHPRRYALNTSYEHFHSHDHGGAQSHSHADHDHDDDHPRDGHHHAADHSHLPPGADGSPITWRSLLALGISGGLLPCPSALVVLLGAIALNRVGFGLILVLAFSLGLAGALTAIGMLFIYAGRLFQRFPSQGRMIAILPVLSALFISVIGIAISIKALAEIGIK